MEMWNDNVSGFDSEYKLKVNNTDTNLSYLSDGSSDPNYKSIILKHKFKQYGGTDIRNFSNMNELPVHTHAISSNGSHTHQRIIPYWPGSFYGKDGDQRMYTVNGGDPTQFKSISTYTHSHVVNSVGASEAFNNMPPYYVLTYIMKT